MLDQKINENEELYNSTKTGLETAMNVANKEYTDLLKDFHNQTGYVQNDNMLSKEGKIQKIAEIKESYLNKVYIKAIERYDVLGRNLDIALKKDEIRKLENYKGLDEKSLPQLIYVNSMVNSISSMKDADLLEDVFNYACEEDNFSDQLINLIYIKARNLINNHIPAENSETENTNATNAIESVQNRKKVTDIISKMHKYKTDYSKEFARLKVSFNVALNQKKYPANLYMHRDPKDDFRLPGELDHSNPWNR